MSEEIIKMGIIGFGVETGMVKKEYANALIALSGVMISLPHGRGQESEADIMGLELMARAGYNPHAAVDLWKKMSANGGGKPPEILSTHPSDTHRIKNIESHLAQVMPLYENSLKH
jgi:predicted Zn-dependent protease